MAEMMAEAVEMLSVEDLKAALERRGIKVPLHIDGIHDAFVDHSDGGAVRW